MFNNPLQNMSYSYSHPVDTHPFLDGLLIGYYLCYLVYTFLVFTVLVHKLMWADIPLPIGHTIISKLSATEALPSFL